MKNNAAGLDPSLPAVTLYLCPRCEAAEFSLSPHRDPLTRSHRTYQGYICVSTRLNPHVYVPEPDHQLNFDAEQSDPDTFATRVFTPTPVAPSPYITW